MTAVDLDGTAKLLRAKREALLARLDAVDRALATLTAAEIIVANVQELPWGRTGRRGDEPGRSDARQAAAGAE